MSDKEKSAKKKNGIWAIIAGIWALLIIGYLMNPDMFASFYEGVFEGIAPRGE